MSWVVKDRGEVWSKEVSLLDHIYRNRGVNKDYDPTLPIKKLEHFRTLKNIDSCAKRIFDAIKQAQNIVIVGDYDTDGATSTTLMMEALKLFGSNNHSYIVPNRFEFSYGLSKPLIMSFQDKKPDLIITVDNGISSFEGVDYANEQGIDVIITDHHLAGETLPNALAIVNPNQPDDTFPSKALAGVGVAFYVLLALRHYFKINDPSRSTPNMAQFLDLVALGTVADLVPLDENNRILVANGIKLIKTKPRPGIQALIEISKKSINHLTTDDIGFHIAPKLNAAGRLDDISIGIQCLMSHNTSQAMQFAHQLNSLNSTRKSLDQQMIIDAKSQMNQLSLDLPVMVLYQEDWHQGVIGILASKIKEEVFKPTFIFAKANSHELKGSARSIPGVNLKALLTKIDEKNPGLIISYGGHVMAAGLTLKHDNLSLFKEKLIEEMSIYDPSIFTKVYVTDGSLEDQDITIKQAINIESGGPWGQSFEEPLFYGRFNILEYKILGEKHLKLALQNINGTKSLPAILFNIDPEDYIHSTQIEAVYYIKINRFRNMHNIQLQIVDARAIHN